MNSYVVEHQLKFQWVGDCCPSRHLFELRCHVFARFGDMNTISNKSVLPFALSICACGSRTITPRTITPRTITPGQLPPGQLPPQITEFPKHKSTKFTSHKVYKSQKVHKLRGQSHNIYEYKFYKIQVSTKVVHGYGKLWSFGGF